MGYHVPPWIPSEAIRQQFSPIVVQLSSGKVIYLCQPPFSSLCPGGGRSQCPPIFTPRTGRELLQERFCLRIDSDTDRVEVEMPKLIAAKNIDQNLLGFHRLTDGRLSVSKQKDCFKILIEV